MAAVPTCTNYLDDEDRECGNPIPGRFCSKCGAEPEKETEDVHSLLEGAAHIAVVVRDTTANVAHAAVETASDLASKVVQTVRQDTSAPEAHEEATMTDVTREELNETKAQIEALAGAMRQILTIAKQAQTTAEEAKGTLQDAKTLAQQAKTTADTAKRALDQANPAKLGGDLAQTITRVTRLETQSNTVAADLAKAVTALCGQTGTTRTTSTEDSATQSTPAGTTTTAPPVATTPAPAGGGSQLEALLAELKS